MFYFFNCIKKKKFYFKSLKFYKNNYFKFKIDEVFILLLYK